MPLSRLRWPTTTSLLAVFFLLSSVATAGELHEKADSLRLGEDGYWRLLLRYERAGSPSGWRSEARSRHFFLSPEGRESPGAELHALVGHLVDDAGGDEAVACRFPARVAWLRERLGLAPSRADCPLLTEWKAAINPSQATLVFASDYLNNPSSMFGHTFLRLDAPSQTEDTRLLAYAVNYAANVADANPLAFAWKGLTGGYPGVFSLMPYYDKVKEYSDLENRDLWEYQLAFTPAELERLLDHLWELRSVEFPYYFLTRNCSFHLLSLFEAARPGLALREDFPLQAIPTDTVRRVIREPGLLRKLVYRPAAERRLLQDARQNPPRVNRAALALARDPDRVTGLDEAEEATALETAYDYRYYRFLAGEQDTGARSELRRLLLRRAANPSPGQRSVPPPPPVDPAQGHPTARLGLGAGHARDAAYATLRLRPAYHDLLDPPGGYRDGAHIDFLDIELRLDDERQRLRLERLAIVDIDSLSSRNAFFQPWSWFFGFGYRQAAVDSLGRFSATESHGVAFGDGGAGSSVSLGDHLDCFAMLAATAEAGPALDDGWRVGTGPRAGCRYGRGKARLRLQLDSRHFSDIGRLETRAGLDAQFDTGQRSGIRIQIGERRWEGLREGFGEAGWIRYF